MSAIERIDALARELIQLLTKVGGTEAAIVFLRGLATGLEAEGKK